MGKPKNSVSLIALDIEGAWNTPLLENAADLSGASLAYASSGKFQNLVSPAVSEFLDVAKGYNTVLACETGVKAQNIFEFPAPRGKTALVVGNEKDGIPKSVLNHCSGRVTIPMFSNRLSSINVAASGAVGVYVLERDLARKCANAGRRSPDALDLFIHAPADPAECGSLLRSAAAFGWKSVYLEDSTESWFSKKRDVLALSRAAARREINPLSINNSESLPLERYDKVILCARDRTGTPLSRYRLCNCRNGLLTYGTEELPRPLASLPCDTVYVDFLNAGLKPHARHEASALLAVIAHQLRRKRHG